MEIAIRLSNDGRHPVVTADGKPVEVANTPVVMAKADDVTCYDDRALYLLAEETGYLYNVMEMAFPVPGEGDKCTNVYGIGGSLRSSYIARALMIEQSKIIHAAWLEAETVGYEPYDQIRSLGGDALAESLTAEDYESITAAVTGCLAESVDVTCICLAGKHSYLSMSIEREQECWRRYSADEEGRPTWSLSSEDAIDELVKSARACMMSLIDRSGISYRNERVLRALKEIKEIDR